MPKTKLGFTLVEILVVITIIAILSAVGLTSYSGLTTKSKDVKKKADIDALADAYELKYNAKDRIYQPLTEQDFIGPIPSSPSLGGLIADSAPAYRICANLASDTTSCSSPSSTCYCKESIHGDLALLSSPAPSGGVSIAAGPGLAGPGLAGPGLAGPGLIPSSTAYRRVFVTSTVYSGNLGGIASADSKCQARADTANLGGTWRAWLSFSLFGTASQRLEHFSGPYRLVNGTTIANSWSDLIDGTIINPIGKNERGRNVLEFGVWTGTNVSGNLANNYCSNWATTSSTGTTGRTNSKDKGWTQYASSEPCNTSYHLYCFEQQGTLPSPPPAILPPSTAYQRVFLTSTTYNGNLGGLTGADSKCQTQADAANLGGTWKSWLSDSQTSAASRLYHATVPYVLVNGSEVAKDWTDLTDDCSLIKPCLSSPINITEGGTKSSSDAWANAGTYGSSGAGTECQGHITTANCENWTKLSGTGLTGRTADIYSSWTCYDAPGCDVLHSLYCFEQQGALPSPVTIACADGTNDQEYSSSMVGCNGSVPFNNASSLCASSSHVCSVTEYLARGGQATKPTGLRWLSTKVGNPIHCGLPEFCVGNNCSVFIEPAGNKLGLVSSRGFSVYAQSCSERDTSKAGWFSTDNLVTPNRGTVCCN